MASPDTNGESLQSHQPEPGLLESRQPGSESILEQSTQERNALLTPEQKAAFEKMREAVDKKDRLLGQIDGIADKFNAVGKGQVSIDKSQLRTTVDRLFYELPSLEAKLTMVEALTKAMEAVKDASTEVPTDVQGAKKKIEEFQRKIFTEMRPFEAKLRESGLSPETVMTILDSVVVIATLALAALLGIAAAKISSVTVGMLVLLVGGVSILVACMKALHYVEKYNKWAKWDEKKVALYQANGDAFLYDVINEFVPNLSADQFKEIHEIHETHLSGSAKGQLRGMDLVDILRTQLTEKMADGTVTSEEFHQAVSYIKGLIEVRP